MVDVALDIPAQSGLLFNVSLNLQNLDELHLSAGALWVSWFPCTRPDRASEYVDSVIGLLSGRYRILEFHRGARAVKARLQRPLGGKWETIATRYAIFALPWPRMTQRVLRNEPPVA
jgi:hypothetical protein